MVPYITYKKNAFENVARKMAAILSRPQYVKSNVWVTRLSSSEREAILAPEDPPLPYSV